MEEKSDIIKKDDILKQWAIKVFGDIIDDAYLTALDHKNEKDIVFKFKQYQGNAIIFTSSEKDMVLKFKNGKSVLFTNSERGTIESINIDTETREV